MKTSDEHNVLINLLIINVQRDKLCNASKGAKLIYPILQIDRKSMRHEILERKKQSWK